MKTANFSRRNLIKLGAIATGTATLAATVGHASKGLSKSVVKTEPPKVSDNLTPDEALKSLMAGNQRFISQKQQKLNQDLVRIKQVANDQKPFAAIVSCADSRVPVEILFDRGFGELFVVREAGNIVTPEETGSIEFGTLVLGAKVLMVLGHERCGAVKATIQGNSVPGQIGSILEAIKPAVDQAKGLPGNELENTTKANVLHQVGKLKASPVISQLIQEGKLKVVGAYYDLDTAAVTLL